MIVMMTAITPSLNASNRPLFIVPRPKNTTQQDRYAAGSENINWKYVAHWYHWKFDD